MLSEGVSSPVFVLACVCPADCLRIGSGSASDWHGWSYGALHGLVAALRWPLGSEVGLSADRREVVLDLSGVMALTA